MLELWLLAVGLAMDASAVAAAAGFSHSSVPFSRGLRMALVFGLFQGVMPCLGWIAGARLADWAAQATPWIAFVILAFLGGRMIRAALRKQEPEEAHEAKSPFAVRTLLGLGVATSLDALAVGVTLPLLGIRLPICAVVIGIVTFLLSAVAFHLGRRLRDKLGELGRRLEIVGGVVLVGVGVRLLVAHLVA